MEGNEILLDSTDDFIDRMRELDVTAVAAAVIDEKRVREEEPGKLSVYHRKSTELIAYRGRSYLQVPDRRRRCRCTMPPARS